MSGDFIFVGANNEDEDELGLNTMDGAGSVYVFKRNTSSSWVYYQKLIALDRSAGAWFGHRIAVNQHQLVVTAAADSLDEFGSNSLNAAGSAYIFELNGSGLWEQTQKIVGSTRKADSYLEIL